jgi:hypothetical protein
MAESEEELAPQKILVRASNGDLWLVRKGANPRKVHSNDPNALPEDQDPELVGILDENETRVANHFNESANPGVKVQISVVDFD